MSDRKIALVTGAAQGLGKAIARVLSENGAEVVVADINEEKAETAAEELRRTFGRGIALGMDVSDNKSISDGVERIMEKYGAIHILVNNAGILQTTPIPGITEEEWNRVFDVNLKGAFFLFQRVLPVMEKQQWGRVVNISSLAGRMGGYENGVAYSAAKAGLIGLTMALARRVAKTGITVNAVAPGTARTEIVEQFTPEGLRSLEKMIPLGRLGEPEDTAEAVAFFASEKAGFITGAVLDVNGGMFMG